MADAFQNPAPLANEYANQAVHKFVVWFYNTFGPGGTVSIGGSPLAIPSGQTGTDITYYGATNNIHTVTYTPSGTILTLTYAAGGAADDDRLTNVTVS